MDKSETIAGNANQHMHRWLMRFCTKYRSPNAAAKVLQCDGLSFQWIKKFAYGEITNPTVDKLQILERRLVELESEQNAA